MFAGEGDEMGADSFIPQRCRGAEGVKKKDSDAIDSMSG
jgi:hypothetical protein